MKNLLELNIMWKKSCLILFLGLAGCGTDAPVAQKLETRMSIPSELIGEQTAFKANPKNSRLGEKINTFIPEDAVILEKMFHHEANFFKVKFFNESQNDTTYVWVKY